MSSDGTDTGPVGNIIQQGIENLRQHNAQANAELTETLQDLREKVAAGYAPATPFPFPDSVPAGTDEFQYKRIMLYGSQWTSEVIAAAALDDTFKEETQERAKQILRDNGMLPPLTEPEGT